MTVLILIFLALTGGAAPPEEGAASPTVSSGEGEPLGTMDAATDPTTESGGDYVRKSPIG